MPMSGRTGTKATPSFDLFIFLNPHNHHILTTHIKPSSILNHTHHTHQSHHHLHQDHRSQHLSHLTMTTATHTIMAPRPHQSTTAFIYTSPDNDTITSNKASSLLQLDSRLVSRHQPCLPPNTQLDNLNLTTST